MFKFLAIGAASYVNASALRQKTCSLMTSRAKNHLADGCFLTCSASKSKAKSMA